MAKPVKSTRADRRLKENKHLPPYPAGSSPYDKNKRTDKTVDKSKVSISKA